MKAKASLNALIAGMVIDDSPRDIDGNIIPPHSGKFLDDGGLKLPTRAFTDDEIEAARAASTGTWDEYEAAHSNIESATDADDE